MGKAFDSITRGLNEAIAHAKGERVAIKTYTPEAVDVSALRQNMGMTQEQFAARFGFSVATLRHWERGDRSPHGASLVLLNVIKRAPDAVQAALN
jgi:putative transcriptional regulator